MSDTSKNSFRAYCEADGRRFFHFFQVGQAIPAAYSVIALEQCIGRKDVAGKDIFEGDIVKTRIDFGTKGKHPKGKPFVFVHLPVVFLCDFFSSGFDTGPKPAVARKIGSGNSTDSYRGEWIFRDCKVVGNIHESPELLDQRPTQPWEENTTTEGGA